MSPAYVPAATAPAGGFVKNPHDPASQAQVDYLKVLLESREVSVWHERYSLVSKIGGLTKGAASDLITGLKASPAKPKPAPAEPAEVTASDIEFGYYMDADGVLWSWQEQKLNKYTDKMVPKLAKLSLSHQHKWIVDPETGVGNWVKVAKGKWVIWSSYTSQKYAPVKLAGLAKMTPAQLAEQSKLFGVCVRCGRTLTAKASVAKSVGPVCAKYLGL